MERWSAINAEDVHLATVRVYTPDAPNKKPRIVLFLPPNSDPSNPNEDLPPQQANRPLFEMTTRYVATGPEPDCYELDMVNDNVENQIVVAERPKDPALSMSTTAAAATVNTRARTTILTGRIKHECNLRPTFTQNYRHQMRERHKKYNTPVRQIRMIDDAGVPGGRGGVNRLSSGVGVGAGGAFGDLIVSSSVVFFLSRFNLTRKQNRNKPKALSSVWLVYHAISSSTNYLPCSVKHHIGVFVHCVKKHSSQRLI